jgi:hypothetical protein
MKTYGGVKVYSTILELGTRWRRMISLTPLPLYPRERDPQRPLDRGLVGFQNRYGRYGEEKNHAHAGNH